jgi:hypothetical protein
MKNDLDDSSSSGCPPKHPFKQIILKMEEQYEENEDDEQSLYSDHHRRPSKPLSTTNGRNNNDSQSPRHPSLAEKNLQALPAAGESQQEIVARIIAQRLAALDDRNGDETHSVDSYPRDPLERLERLDEEALRNKNENNRVNEGNTGTGGRTGSKETNSNVRLPGKAHKDHLDGKDKELVQRIVEMRIATIEAGEQEEISSEPPQDPLVRIMNMNAEDTLVVAAALMQYYGEPDESDEDEDRVVRNKDIFDLNNMIQHDYLDDLQRRAMVLAESVKNKLERSSAHQVDSSWEHNTSSSHTTGIGYIALAKDAVNRSYSLDFSKVGDDDDDGMHRRDSTSDEGSFPTFIQPNKKHSMPSRITISSTSSKLGPMESIGKEQFINSPSDSNALLSTHVEAFASDWWGVVGDFAGAGCAGSSSTWESDSQSGLSCSSTDSIVTGSTASLEDSMKKLAKKKTGEIIDWEGINAAIKRQHETSEAFSITGKGPGESALEEKRRKKRELEAWKKSLDISVEKRETDAWRSSLLKSGL